MADVAARIGIALQAQTGQEEAEAQLQAAALL